ncbi:transcription factor bHLH110-like [Canna indica]|uniref:Transcription factor bHLH110-like n=1 Tax=Canna indica TaxID=4628 RepID=A0AAQ3JX48_9LILI|nr:transcription factor bHLH110-like [Canna indica]
MMGSSSHLDHYHQEELHGFSSLATLPAIYDIVPGSHEWNQTQFLNGGNGVIACGQRDFNLSHNILPASSQMIQDLGFHLPSINEEGFLNLLPTGHQLNLEKVKEELPDNSYLKLSEISVGQLHPKFFLRAIACSGCGTDGSLQLNASETPSFHDYGSDRENFNFMAFPGSNLSQSISHPPQLFISGSIDMDMDLRALDLLTSARLGRSFCQPSFIGMNMLGEDVSSGLNQLHDSAQEPVYHHQKMPSLVSGVAEATGSSCSWQHKSAQTAPRKPRFEQRSSFSPFKVRKEKLGDRIAALQQLVAPFGKTDTASVLMEAIGYIKFLLDQVEKLSVPYMRSSSNKRSRTVQEASLMEEPSNEPKRDLRSRGLCLVPLSCTSYMTSEHGVWSPFNFGGSG